MTYEQLKYYIAVYETGSINQASSLVFVSPQGISSGLRKLEDELNVELFSRSNTGLTPTELSNLLYPVAKEIVSKFDAFRGIAANACPGGDRLRIGVLGDNHLADEVRAAAELSCQHSGYRPELVMLDSTRYQTCLEMLVRRELDIACMFHTEKDSKFNYYPLWQGNMKCAVSANSDLAKKGIVTWPELADLNFIFPERDGLYTHLIEAHCRKYGFTPRAKYYSLDSNYMAQLISKGLASCFSFWEYIDRLYKSYPEVVFLELEPPLKFTASLITLSEHTTDRLAAAVAGLLREFEAAAV